jgi:hypothetical protein
MTDVRAAGELRLAGGLMAGGMLLEALVTAFHPAGEDPNAHRAVFAEYARDDSWQAVHLGQFAAALVVIAGLLVLHRALGSAGSGGVLRSLAFGAAVATAGAVAVLQVVDGVMLKQAVDSWAGAPGPQQASAFGDAQLARWLEWGVNSQFRLFEGLTATLFGVAVTRSTLAPRWLGFVGVAAGAAYATIGVLVAYSGFTSAAMILGFAADPLFLVFAVGLAVAGWKAESYRREAIAD